MIDLDAIRTRCDAASDRLSRIDLQHRRLIATSAADVPALLAEVERLRAALAVERAAAPNPKPQSRR